MKSDIMVVEKRVPLYGLEDASGESEENIIDRIDCQKAHHERSLLLKESQKMIKSSKRKAGIILLFILSQLSCRVNPNNTAEYDRSN